LRFLFWRHTLAQQRIRISREIQSAARLANRP
jgi:hypothetical protein